MNVIKKEETITDLEKIEVRLLLEGIYKYYGYDFRDYAMSSIRRLLLKQAAVQGLSTISALQERILHNRQSFEQLIHALSVGTTSLFRDPRFYISFRRKVVPKLKTYPFVRIWHAGCSSGEEVLSMAILLTEEDLYHRAKIYATDFHPSILKKAKSRQLSTAKIAEYSQNYLDAGGKYNLLRYYTPMGAHVLFDSALLSNVTYMVHNLVTDDSFQEFNVILCRNVLIYFSRSLQNRAHDVLYRSLCRLGVFCLGKKESMNLTSHDDDYKVIDGQEKIYQRMS